MSILRVIGLWISRKCPGGMRLWVTLFSLTFVLLTLLGNGDNLNKILVENFDQSFIALGIIVALLSLLLNAFAWQILVDWLGYDNENVFLIPLFLSSNLLKYLPGGIWHFVERLRILRRKIGDGPAMASVFLEPFIMLVAAFLCIPFGGWQSGLSLSCFLPLLILLPKFREPLLRSVEQKNINQINKVDSSLSKSLISEDLNVSRAGYPWIPLLAEVIFIIFRFGSFFCCLLAFSATSSLHLGTWLSVFSLAWVVGLVVPAAPGGLGVFEATLLLRLGPTASELPLLAILLSYRIVTTFADLFAASGVSIYKLILTKRSQ